MPTFELRIEVHQFFAGNKPDEPGGIIQWTERITAQSKVNAATQAKAITLNTVKEYENRVIKDFRRFIVITTLRPITFCHMRYPGTPHIQK